jgi:hypothetical protein
MKEFFYEFISSLLNKCIDGFIDAFFKNSIQDPKYKFNIKNIYILPTYSNINMK